MRRGSRLEVIEVIVVHRLGLEDIQPACCSGLLAGGSRSGRGSLLFSEINQVRFRLFRGRWLRLSSSGTRRTWAPPWRACIALFVLIVLLELVASPAEVLEVVRATSKPASIPENASTVSPVSHTVATKPPISATGAGQAASDAHTALETAELIPVGPGFLPLRSDHINIPQQFDELGRPIAHIDTLILPVLVDEMELAEHSQERHVGPRIVDDSFRSVLNKELQQLETLPGVHQHIVTTNHEMILPCRSVATPPRSYP